MASVLVLMHGFGGRPEDFDGFIHEYRKFSPTTRLLTPDFYSDDGFHPEQSLQIWESDFFSWLTTSAGDSASVWLVGYSMGGRLAMHAICRRPDLFGGAVFLSSSPGFETDVEKQAREAWDLAWAGKIRGLPFSELQQQWNALPVFEGSESQELRSDVNRDILAENLCQWSPARHLFTISELQQCPVPRFWVCGENDSKYRSLYERLRHRDGLGEWSTLQGAGHRLLVPSAQGITGAVYEFIRSRGGLR